VVKLHPLNRKLVRDLWRLRGQALAIALIVASGVAVLVMSLATTEALRETTIAYYERQHFADVFASAKRAPQSLAARIGAIPGVQLVETRIVRYATVDVAGFGEPVIATLVTVPERGESLLNQVTLRRGRMLDPSHTDEALVSEAFAKAHRLAPGDRLRVLMNGRQRDVEIAGTALSPEFIYTIGPGALMPDPKRYGVLWMNQRAIEAAYDLDGAFNDVVLTVMAGASERLVIEAIDVLLEPYGGRGAYPRDDQISHWFVMNEIEQLETMARILPSVFLAVAAILTNIVLARLVAIERAEIGLLKAFGYSGAAVAWHYAKLVVAMSGLGVLLGWALGFWLGRWMTEIYAELYRFPDLVYMPGARSFVISAVVSLGAALVGAIAAARRAGRLAPAEAMRPPSPPLFRRRAAIFPALARWLDQPTRIVLRQVMRRPLRAFLTSLGAATSVAVLVTALQWIDAVNLIVEDFFYRQQHQDVTVGLVEPARDDVVRAALRLPGVLAVEPHRVVAARLTHEQRSRREAVIGLPANGQLETLHTADGDVVTVPEDGLLLSSALAEILDAGVGDTITVEELEGRRSRIDVPVAAVYDTYIGTSAYMNLAALTRAIGEPATANTLLLRLDPASSATFFAELKTIPAIGGATVKAAAVDMFHETMGETMLVFVSFYVFFSCTLAIGVVYNNLRIALSERGRELATLRVLGFRTGEITYMLLGEAALLVLLALPIGALLGWALASLMAASFATELFRVPVVIQNDTYAYAMLVAVAAAVASALLVQRRLQRLDLIAVLKTRE
jgi:putative ABC transport system permease protein